MERCAERISLTGAGGLAVPPEIDRQDAKARLLQRLGLLPPALLVESSPVSEYDAPAPFPYRSAWMSPPSRVGKVTCSCAAAIAVRMKATIKARKVIMSSV